MLTARRGQSTNRVGTMILLITVILLLYILFLPPQDRDQILYNESDPLNGDFNESITERLLDVEPGDLEYVDRERRRHSIPAYSVSSQVEGVQLLRENSASPQRSLFNERRPTYQFTTTPSLTDDVLLTFNVESASGELTVRLNGEPIYVDHVSKGSITPISIDKDRLASSNNLTFSVSSPGVAFWATNQVQLENVQVTADVRDTSRNRNHQTFYIPQDDYSRIERVEAQYIATCTEADVEGFDITVNNYVLFEGIPDCALQSKKSFDPGVLKPGQNTLMTTIEQGSVLVDRFRVTTYFGDTEEKTYYFEVDDEYFHDAQNGSEIDGDVSINASFTFADDDEKQFNYFVNGRRTSITTREPSLTRSIENRVLEGTNVVRIEPRNDFTMSRHTVNLRDDS